MNEKIGVGLAVVFAVVLSACGANTGKVAGGLDLSQFRLQGAATADEVQAAFKRLPKASGSAFRNDEIAKAKPGTLALLVGATFGEASTALLIGNNAMFKSSLAGIQQIANRGNKVGEYRWVDDVNRILVGLRSGQLTKQAAAAEFLKVNGKFEAAVRSSGASSTVVHQGMGYIMQQGSLFLIMGKTEIASKMKSALDMYVAQQGASMNPEGRAALEEVSRTLATATPNLPVAGLELYSAIHKLKIQ